MDTFPLYICQRATDETIMLFCDDCDRGYHTFCLDPPMTNLPDGKWFCELCKDKHLDNDDKKTD